MVPITGTSSARTCVDSVQRAARISEASTSTELCRRLLEYYRDDDRFNIMCVIVYTNKVDKLRRKGCSDDEGRRMLFVLLRAVLNWTKITVAWAVTR